MTDTRPVRAYVILLCACACLAAADSAYATDLLSESRNDRRCGLKIEIGGAYFAGMPLAIGAFDRSLWSTHVASSVSSRSRLSFRAGYELGGIVFGGSGHVFHHGPFLGGRYDFVRSDVRPIGGLFVGADIRVRWMSGFRRSPIVGVTASGGLPITIGGRVTMVNEVAGGWFFGDAAHLVIGIRNAIVLAF